jgi:formylglycine-generating enzyme required for sulfatase activity
MRDELARLRAELEEIKRALADPDALPAAQRDIVLAALRTQRDTLQARIIEIGGSGSVAMGEQAAAAGAGGVAVVGDVYGDIYTGPPPVDAAEALAIYRRVLVQASRHLPLRGVDLGASDPTGGQQRFDLAQVYVNLDTKTQVPLTEEEKQLETFAKLETRPLGVLKATMGNPHLVILGDPGSGKSTFLKHLALCLAAYGLESKGRYWLTRLPGWPEAEANALPIPVVLRDFASWLPEDVKRAEPCHLWDFVVSRLNAQNLAFAAKPLHQALEKGEAVVLLDGLDEIPTRGQRTFVRDAVAAFAGRYPQSRLVITCRTLSYQDPAWQLGSFPAFELAPLDEEKIDRFIKAWYGELARMGVVKTGEADRLAQGLQEAVRRPDMWRLAPNPLLLTVMALVHTHKGRLPNARALLYEDTVDVLLWRWEQIKVGGEEAAPRLRRLLLEAGRTDVDLKRTLWRLAFEAHQEGGAGDEVLADVGELRLEKALAELHPKGSRDWAHQVIKVMKLRAGLLLERAPEVYTFPHRTFQEYLAGAHLSAQADFAKQAVELVEEGAFWREVVLLAVGRLVYLGGDTDKPLALVGELCPRPAMDDEVAWRKAWMAGEVLVEMGLNRVQDSALGQDLAGRVRHRLAGLVGKGRLGPVERAAAGRALAKLGDSRFRPDTWYLPNEPLLGFVEVSAGSFLMGTREEDIPNLLERFKEDEHLVQLQEDVRNWRWYFLRETPQYEITLPTYYIARYPVTNAQFRVFVEDPEGYLADRWWTETGLKWREDREGPEKLGEPFNLPNHPVARVTWYEALAFAHWLTEMLRDWEGTPEPLRRLLRDESYVVTLPSEAEWEKAARGTDGRIFPWGNEANPNLANCKYTGIGTTSAVGCFPSGASPYGVKDMIGNAWEWTRSLYRGSEGERLGSKYPYDPRDGREDLSAGDDTSCMVRGGAFYNNEWYTRCAGRNWTPPDGIGGAATGFRVCIASQQD